jgi:hypothetical protein
MLQLRAGGQARAQLVITYTQTSIQVTQRRQDPHPAAWTSPVNPDAVVSSGRRRWPRRTVRRVLDIRPG